VYFAERIGQDLGVKINYVSTEAANRIEYLQTGKVDIILANFTVTEERAQEVDFALPYMNVALGVVSPSDDVIDSLDNVGADDEIIVISGTTAETYLEKNYPDIKLQKYDAYAEAKTAIEMLDVIIAKGDNKMHGSARFTVTDNSKNILALYMGILNEFFENNM
jgi:polar amino acid transport system substrate-binding protein